MSWLNFNESLNSIKGQISSFASGVLTDEPGNDVDTIPELSTADRKVQELQNLCASKDVEIASLRRTTAELYEKLSANAKVKNDCNQTNGAETEDHWFWDPPSSETITNDKTAPTNNTTQANSSNSTISDLTNKIKELEVEKNELIQSLEQLDIDCQKTTDKLVTLKDDLQSDYNNLQKEYDSVLKENLEHTQANKKYLEEIQVLRDANLKLQTDINNSNITNVNNEYVQLETVNKELNTLKSQYNNILIKYDGLKDVDERYQILKTEHENLKVIFDKAQSDTVKHNELLEDYKCAQGNISDLETKNGQLQDKINLLNDELGELKLKKLQPSNLSDDHKKLQDMYDELKLVNSKIEEEKCGLHKRYVDILTETVKKYVDCDIPDEDIHKSNDDPHLPEFKSKVEIVLKLLLDFKWKTEALEKKLCEISREKSVAITEKNHEIEKLLHNSEILSQEVITKTQTIKDYELECSELIKNNNLLIADLQQYKNNNALQTISESNEDNLLLLETQLENANKRIRELELVISDLENSKQDNVLETQTELDYIKKQVNMTGEELSQSKKEYHNLLSLFHQYENDNKQLHNELFELKSSYANLLAEKNALESANDKLKSDLENMEYKFAEANINLETINEEFHKLTDQSNMKDNELNNEINNLKTHIGELTQNQAELKSNQRNAIDSSNMFEITLNSIKAELNDEIAEKFQLEERCKSFEDESILINDALNNLITETESLIDIQGTDVSVLQKIETIKQQLKTVEVNRDMIIERAEAKLRSLQDKFDYLVKEHTELIELKITLETKASEANHTIKTLQERINSYENEIESLRSNHNQIESFGKEQIMLKNEISSLQVALEKSSNGETDLQKRIAELESENLSLNSSIKELVDLVTVKDQENKNYYTEIQRLNQIIIGEIAKSKEYEEKLNSITVTDNSALIEQQITEIEKLTDQVNFLKEKCEKLAVNLCEEQSNVQKVLSERQNMFEKEQTLTKDLERLRLHLFEIENSYTQELLQAEQRNQEMLSKVNEIEQRERDSSNIYTSVNIRANQQVETLTNQLQLISTQRDELQKKISEAEDRNNKQYAALTNLQCVLEQFQKDKEKDIFNETNRIRRQINAEKLKQDELQSEINSLKVQLEESKQGLQAAARLTEQVEKSKQQVHAMKEEVVKYQDQLAKTEEKYNVLLNQTDTKVDKLLIKNLIVGLISTNNNLNKDQSQVLKIIATVLDFNQQDIEKVQLNKPVAGSWLGAILHPQAMNANPNMSQQSLSEAFVRFLESESQPKQIPTLLDIPENAHASSSKSQSSRKNSLLLNEVVLPTFADFAQNRNSSSILKDVLKENN